MTIKQKDLKLLWGRSGNLCAICKCELSYDANAQNAKVPLGEQAHIVAEEQDGPRGKSILITQERNSYANLVLLCPTHHALVDKAADDFPIEKLHQIKTDHELWVREKLSTSSATEEQNDRMVYSDLVDEVVTRARFATWNSWASMTLSPWQHFPKEIVDGAFPLWQKINAAVWPGTLPELEESLKVFSIVYLTAINIFLEHVSEKDDGDILHAHKYYRISPYEQDLYDRLLKEWEIWCEVCDELVRESTRAANWVGTVVRRELNPMFYVLEGKFYLTEGSHWRTSIVHEYASDELVTLSQSIDERLKAIIAPYRNTERASSTP